ncbi:unnamed protein product, partial [Iphiclides podalirius]
MARRLHNRRCRDKRSERQPGRSEVNEINLMQHTFISAAGGGERRSVPARNSAHAQRSKSLLTASSGVCPAKSWIVWFKIGAEIMIGARDH